jgi:hypothetical protein
MRHQRAAPGLPLRGQQGLALGAADGREVGKLHGRRRQSLALRETDANTKKKQCSESTSRVETQPGNNKLVIIFDKMRMAVETEKTEIKDGGTHLVEEDHLGAGGVAEKAICSGLLAGQLQHGLMLGARLPDHEGRAQLQLAQPAVHALILEKRRDMVSTKQGKDVSFVLNNATSKKHFKLRATNEKENEVTN